MKHKKISMKWKVFFYLLGFTVILLFILWLFQICYLDTFYKKIKTAEAEQAMGEMLDIVISECDTISDTDQIPDAIDSLAAEYNLSIAVTDETGAVQYSAEYIPNSKMEMIPQMEFLRYYQEAQENGGSTKIEFEGSHNMTFPNLDMLRQEKNPIEGMGIPERTGEPEEQSDLQERQGFVQNHGQEMAESVIYVRILETGSGTRVILMNSVLTPIDATVTTLKTQLIYISVIMLLLSLLISFLISRKMTKSIVKINESAKELAKGDYSISFAGNDCREIAELSDTLNFATRELEKTEGLRRELIANVSHDLRTPLTMIIAYAEGMRDLPGENTPENIQVVIDESRRLTNLVNDMLDLSKLQAGVMEKEVGIYNLTESIEKVLQRYNKLVEQEGYNIVFEYEDEVFVQADEFKIFQVIYNLVNNAINYTGEDKRVTVRQISKAGKVRIEVEDSGLGIKPEELPYVWERYYKVDKTHKRAVAGTGIGLSIVKNILILHQAEYGVDSQPGCGSTFWFQLELAPEE